MRGGVRCAPRSFGQVVKELQESLEPEIAEFKKNEAKLRGKDSLHPHRSTLWCDVVRVTYL